MDNMRDAFGRALVELGKVREDFVVLDADVAGGTGTYHFRETFPDRFIQCGIAEQNMFSMAAGLSTTGVIPVVTCYAVFASMRAIEQARNSIAYPEFNVKIAASHLGLDVGPDGATHQSVEDMAFFRAIPNFKVASPADPNELNSTLSAVLDTPGPVYLRTGRSPLPTFLEPGTKFQFGRSHILAEGDDAAIMAVGVMVHRALETAQLLKEKGISVRVVNLSSIKPLDIDLIVQSAQKTGLIVTAEDHNIIGGLGSAVAEVLALNHPCPMVMMGIQDCFGESGEPQDLAVKYQLTSQDIANRVMAKL